MFNFIDNVLHNKSFYVQMNDYDSNDIVLKGIPQGSMIVPTFLAFILTIWSKH